MSINWVERTLLAVLRLTQADLLATPKPGRKRRCNIKSKAQSTFGNIVFVIGILLTVGGLCILLVNLLRQ